MTAITAADQAAARVTKLRAFNIGGGILTVLTVLAATLWAFPLYWAAVTTLKPEYEVVEPGIRLWPKTLSFDAYTHVFVNTNILRWYLNSLITSAGITVIVVFMGATCGYAISQLRFPGRRLIYTLILASFMVPIQALIITHFVLMADFGLINTWLGIILPQLIVPVIVIVYKQFFDSVARDFREAAVMAGASEFQLLFRIFLPMNWGVTHRACDHHLHRCLEQLPVAVPGADLRKHHDSRGGHYAGPRRLRSAVRTPPGGRGHGRAAGRDHLSHLPASGDPGDHTVGRHQGLI
jgi:multiple sugar transport system permease protein